MWHIRRGGEKRKWEGSSDFSKKKNSQHKENGDKAVVRSVVTCKRCCKPGYKKADCKSPDLVCYKWEKMGPH